MPRVDEQLVDLLLRHRDAAGRLPDVDELRAGAARGRAARATRAGRTRRRRRARSSSSPRRVEQTRDHPGPRRRGRRSRDVSSTSSSVAAALAVEQIARRGARRRRPDPCPRRACAARCDRRARRAARRARPRPSSRRRVASAPHGRSQPPPSSARNARSARDRDGARPDRRSRASARAASRRRRRGTRPRARLARPAAASPPASSTSVAWSREAEPLERGDRDDDRVVALARRACAAGSRCCRAAARTRDRAGAAASCARRRTEPVPIAPAGRDLVERASRRARRADRPRSGTAASTSPAGVVGRQILGRVHREVGAAVEHGLLHFLHEHARAADRVQIGASGRDRRSS